MGGKNPGEIKLVAKAKGLADLFDRLLTGIQSIGSGVDHPIADVFAKGDADFLPEMPLQGMD